MALGRFISASSGLVLRGLLPTSHTLSSSLPAFHGLALHAYAFKLALAGNSYVMGDADADAALALLDEMTDPHVVSVKMGALDDARELFDGMPSKVFICWNATIDGYTQHGRPNEALRLFRRMLLRSGVEPDEVTIVLALSALQSRSSARRSPGSGSMPASRTAGEFSLMPGLARRSLACMYCKCGSLEDAVSVFDSISHKDIVVWNAMINGYAMINGGGSMTIIPDTVIWVSLLAACQLHKNMGKEPGCNAIEVGRKVYEFVASDMSHPRTDEINAMLEKMNGIVKEQGHVPQTELVR
uniref:Pentatricopeptide repeat-containing protein n=1 Tax=Oryza barthii TaxID=65489 RepID=A0A0D3GLJ0_9ORYZ